MFGSSGCSIDPSVYFMQIASVSYNHFSVVCHVLLMLIEDLSFSKQKQKRIELGCGNTGGKGGSEKRARMLNNKHLFFKESTQVD